MLVIERLIPSYPRPPQNRVDSATAALASIEGYFPPADLVESALLVRAIMSRGFTPAEAMWSVYCQIQTGRYAVWDQFDPDRKKCQVFTGKGLAAFWYLGGAMPAGLECVSGTLALPCKGKPEFWDQVLVEMPHDPLPIPPSPTELSEQRTAAMRDLWRMMEPMMDSWLNAGPPGELGPSLKDRNWQAEMPYMDWSEDGALGMGLDSNGRWCARCKDSAEIPSDLEQYVTTSFSISGGRRIDHKYFPFDSPPLADYQRFRRYEMHKRIYDDVQAWNQVHDQIIDVDNPNPIPLSISRTKPQLVAWLNGENPDYAPTMAEFKILWPAFVERRRRLKERAMSLQPQADGPWSEPATPREWASRYRMSWDALKKRFDDQSIRNKKLSIKSYRVHVDDLPRSPDSA